MVWRPFPPSLSCYTLSAPPPHQQVDQDVSRLDVSVNGVALLVKVPQPQQDLGGNLGQHILGNLVVRSLSETVWGVSGWCGCVGRWFRKV